MQNDESAEHAKVEFPATIVVDVYKDRSGLWFGTSRMMRNLVIVGKTKDEVLTKVPGALSDFTAICRERDEETLPIYYNRPTETADAG